MFIDTTTGMPQSISTSSDENGENLFYRARRINEKNSREVVYDLTFSLPKSRASECKLILKQNGIPKLTVNNLSTVSYTKTDILNAIQDTVGEGSGHLCIKSETPTNYLYRFYGVLNANPNDSISTTLVDTAGLVMDTLKSPIGISEDIGHMNIISTIYALTAMPSGTTDPLNPDSITKRADSTMLKLLITAMMDLSLAHNSPQPDSNEISQGIFTNYMQFMDNVVGKWPTIGAGAGGIVRLRSIHNAILDQNKVEIIDPVQIVNKGTCYEGNKNLKRQNYAFYQGFSRINWELEKPDYSLKKAGTGVMFRISENIEIYGAKLGVESAVFDTASFLNGSLKKRIILKSSDSMLTRISGDSSGCWIKGIPETEKEKFDFGITPVRLTIKNTTIDTVKTGIPFSLTEEEKRSDDIEGKIIGDGERSILKIYALSNNGTQTDTLKNISEPGVLLHHQKRVLEYNKDYMMGDKIDFQVVTKPVDSGKVFIDKSQSSGYRATLVDTSVTLKEWTGNVFEYLDGVLVRCINFVGLTRRLGLCDAKNGKIEIWCNKIAGIAIDRDSSHWIESKYRNNINILFRSKGGVEIYDSRGQSLQLFPKKVKEIGTTKGDNAYLISWGDYEKHFLRNDSIFATVDQGMYGEFEIIAQYQKTSQEYTKEKAIVLGVPKIENIEFTSDHENSDGNNILHNSEFCFDVEEIFSEPEWVWPGTESKPISHTRNLPVSIKLNMRFPKDGLFRIEGNSTNSILQFDLVCYGNNLKSNIINTTSKSILPNYPCVLSEEVIWNVYQLIEGVDVKINEIISNHKIYVTYDKPIEITSYPQKRPFPNQLTTKRLEKAISFISGIQENPDSAVTEIWNETETRADFLDASSESRADFREIWKIWDCIDYRIPPEHPEYRAGQCGEYSFLMENMCSILGIKSAYMHVLPSKDTIRVNSGEWPILKKEDLHITRDDWHEHIGDSLFEGIPINVQYEGLMFLFAWGSPNNWQDGEGTLFYNNNAYTMFADQIIGRGTNQKSAARSVMLQLQDKNPVGDKPLQRWAIVFIQNGRVGKKACITGDTVSIPLK